MTLLYDDLDDVPMAARLEERFELSGITYFMTRFLCNGCYKYDKSEPHYHFVCRRDWGEDEAPSEHQGQKMMAEYKDTDAMAACNSSDPEGYCRCRPDYAHHNPEVWERTLRNYEVEWNPELTF